MIVKELIEKLQAVNQEADVLTYIEEAEEYGKTTNLKVFTADQQEEMPYAKGDKPVIERETVLISGWLA